jgi:hypothetical protein
MIRKSLLCASLAGAAVAIAVGVAPSESYANTVSFTLTSDHCDGGCGPQAGGFGSIVVTDAAGGGVDLTLTLYVIGPDYRCELLCAHSCGDYDITRRWDVLHPNKGGVISDRLVGSNYC